VQGARRTESETYQKIGELSSTARRRNSPAQSINQRLPYVWHRVGLKSDLQKPLIFAEVACKPLWHCPAALPAARAGIGLQPYPANIRQQHGAKTANCKRSRQLATAAKLQLNYCMANRNSLGGPNDKRRAGCAMRRNSDRCQRFLPPKFSLCGNRPAGIICCT
jgi:hypothetical protein